MDRIGAAVVGLGVGAHHARAYAAAPGTELRWVHDLDARKAEELVKSIGHGAVAPDYATILRDPEVHIVSIASFDDAHAKQVLAALEAGKHVFVEKPLCRSMEELRTIRGAWNKHGGRLKLSSNLLLRKAPVYGWLKESIDQGEFGDLYSFDADYLYGRIHKITDGWRKDVPDYSVMLGGGVHLVDLLRWTTGQRPTSAWAAGNRIATRNTAFASNDYVAATFRFPSSLVARVTANFGCVHPHQHVVRVFGTRATFLLDDQGPRVHRDRADGARAEPLNLPRLPPSKGELIAPFLDAIRRDQDLSEHTQTMFDVMSICAAADRSAATGVPVEVEYV